MCLTLPLGAQAAFQLGDLYLFNNSSLVGYWKLEGLTDETSGARTLTNNNSVTFTAGRFYNAATFPDPNTNKDLTNATSPVSYAAHASPFTTHMWFLTSSSTPQQEIFDEFAYDGTHFREVEMLVPSASHKVLFTMCCADAGGTSKNAQSDVTLTLNTWYMLDGIYDGTNLKLYINGALAASVVAPWGNFTGASRTGMAIGSQHLFGGSGSSFVDGQIDDVAVYTVALTEPQMNDLYQGYMLQLSNGSTKIQNGNINIQSR